MSVFGRTENVHRGNVVQVCQDGIHPNHTEKRLVVDDEGGWSAAAVPSAERLYTTEDGPHLGRAWRPRDAAQVVHASVVPSTVRRALVEKHHNVAEPKRIPSDCEHA